MIPWDLVSLVLALASMLLFLVSFGTICGGNVRRFLTVYAVGCLCFVSSDVIDLLTTGPSPTPIQQMIGAPLFEYWIGRIVFFSAAGAIAVGVRLGLPNRPR